MEAYRYQLEVAESPTDAVHGVTQTITEIYIPKLDMFINEKFVFFEDKPDRVPDNTETIILNSNESEHIHQLVAATMKQAELHKLINKTYLENQEK